MSFIIDDSKTFTVVLLTTQAQITSIVVRSAAIDYDVYPGGVQAYALMDNSIGITVWVKNLGTTGEINIVIREGANEIYRSMGNIVPEGGQTPFSASFLMPNRNVTLTVDVGH